MATTADTFTGWISRKVGADRQGLLPEDFVAQAVRDYEGFRPREVVADITGDGTQSYPVTDLTSWVVGRSDLKWIEYQVDQTPPQYLDANEFVVRRIANTGTNAEVRAESLYLHNAAPAATETFRVCYTAPHTVTAGASGYSTIPAEDEQAVADFGAARFLEEVAVRYSGLVSQSGLMAEQVIAYTEKASDARANADAARKRARVSMGLPADPGDDSTPQSVGLAVVDGDLSFHERTGALTHRPRYR